MKTLDRATPYFIRCVKSNNDKVPNYFDDNIILRQLRYTGMLETVRIRRAGYSVRIEYGVRKSFMEILYTKKQYFIICVVLNHQNRELSKSSDLSWYNP